LLFFNHLLDAAYGIQASGIADVGQALGYDFDQEVLVIAEVHIAGHMAHKL
jgi:hypothetical protein